MATISIIVPCHNARATLARTLQAIARDRAAGLPVAELIVVDDASTDGCADLARAVGADVVRLETNHGDAAARNTGARRATGDLLWFVDADVEPRPDCGRRLAAALACRPDFAAAIGSYDDAPSAPGLCSQFKNLMHHYVHQQAGDNVSTFWTGCGMIRRTVFEEIGGFDDAFWPGSSITDLQLGYALTARGHHIAMAREAQATHHKRWTTASLVRTDLLQRAIPWTVLLWRHRGLGRGELNLAPSARIAVAATWLAGLMLVLSPLRPEMLAGAVPALAIATTMHATFLAFLRRRCGLVFAVRAVPLLWLYDAYCGLGFLIGTFCAWTGLRPAPRRVSAPPPASVAAASDAAKTPRRD